MRGKADSQTGTFVLINVEGQLKPKHPLREVKAMCKTVLQALEPQLAMLYSEKGRPSIPPERLLMAWVLMCLYGVRSCRRFAEDLQFNLLYKWFLDMNPDEPGFDASSFSKNLERFEHGHVSELFFMEVVDLAKRRGWVSDEHFSVDGTLIQSWASLKSFRRKDEPPPPPEGRNGWVDFKGQKRSNETHQSSTDPEARLARKSPGQEARLSFAAHAVTENRNGLLVLFDVKAACHAGCTEPEVALSQIDELTCRGHDVRTIGADKGYHTGQFVKECREREVAPHVAMVKGRKTPGLDGRTTRSKGYQLSQRARKRVEEPFGWMKSAGNFRRSRWKGIARTHFMAQFMASACNLLRMVKLAFSEAEGPPVTAAA